MARLIAKYEPPPRDWYENPPVVYGFNFPKVRARLEWLMGSHVVQALDRGYHHMLKTMMAEDFEKTVKKKNHEREREEINREKQLVLEGKMPVEDAPKGISNNAVLRINAFIKEIAEEKEKMSKMRVVPVYTYDYRIVQAFLQTRGVKKTGYGETVYDISTCYKLPIIRRSLPFKPPPPAPKDREEEGSEAATVEGDLFRPSWTEEDEEQWLMYRLSPEEYKRSRPQDPSLNELYNTKNVDELYGLADSILGYEPSMHSNSKEVTIIGNEDVEEIPT